jgi:hypothetical protein
MRILFPENYFDFGNPRKSVFAPKNAKPFPEIL